MTDTITNPDAGATPARSAGCPMAAKCARMIGGSPSPLLLLVPGLALILLGVLMVIEPRILVWVAAAAAVALGVVLLTIGNLMRRASAPPESPGGGGRARAA